jgi:hypothetical protein
MPTIVDVLLEADPNSLDIMRQRVEVLAGKDDRTIGDVSPIVRLQRIPQLHFMSAQIFEDPHFDPLLVIENNFDGDPDTYWNSVLDELSDDLRAVFACTKQAKLAKWAPLFAQGNRSSLIDFLKAHSQSPSAQHFGAVAYSVAHIQRDRGVFNDLQAELGVAATKWRHLGAIDIQKDLRQWAILKYPWMSGPEFPTTAEAISTYKRSAWKPVLPWLIFFVTSISLLLWFGFSDYLPSHGHFSARIVLRSLLAIAVVILLLFAVFLWSAVRNLESTDFTQSNPQLSADQLKQFANEEDQIVQNHLASMVLVKAGAIRAFLIRVSLRLLKFGVPLVASNGYLGSMRTIHFAHWTLVGNSGRLLFLSNFDGSWQSYLDDFVDKAARGLTLAWGNCVGFPPTRDLVLEGSARGTQFKAWARQSQTHSILWYSAYSDLSVNQIIRNASIVDGLRKSSMQLSEAKQWTQLL